MHACDKKYKYNEQVDSILPSTTYPHSLMFLLDLYIFIIIVF